MKKTKLQILSILFLPLLLTYLVFGGCAKGAAKKPAPKAHELLQLFNG